MKKDRPRMPVGAPLSVTSQVKLHKGGNSLGAKAVFDEYRLQLKNEFNFKTGEPTAKDMGIASKLAKAWGSNTLVYLRLITENYQSFQAYAHETLGEPLYGNVPQLPVLLKYQSLAPNFAQWHHAPKVAAAHKSPSTKSQDLTLQQPEKQQEPKELTMVYPVNEKGGFGKLGGE